MCETELTHVVEPLEYRRGNDVSLKLADSKSPVDSVSNAGVVKGVPHASSTAHINWEAFSTRSALWT